jgi:glucokinase
MSVDFAFPVLIGDIGGTNARFAIIPDKEQAPVRYDPVQLSHFSQIGDAIRHATAGHDLLKPRTTVLAIATPLVGERFRLTNADWIIDPTAMIREFGLEEVALMNDFAAQGLAALALQKEHLSQIGEGRIVEGHPKAVVGAGTGLGIAQIVRIEGKWAILSGEGGHVDLGPRTEREFAIWPHLAKIEGRMSAEEALSGRGIENLYAALCAADGAGRSLADAAGVSAAAFSRTDPRASEAIDLFFTLLGRVAGDMALLTLARGGVYLAGGIAQKLLPAIDPVRFRAAFTDKAPHRAILSEIPVLVMTHPTAALEGLAAWVREPEKFSLEGATRRFVAGM